MVETEGGDTRIMNAGTYDVCGLCECGEMAEIARPLGQDLKVRRTKREFKKLQALFQG